MDKRRLHHFWTRFRRINPWLFLAVGVASLIIFSFAYRQNNLISIKLAQQLTEVDKANGDVSAALNKLRVHIYGHMNAGLRSENGVQQPIQLKYTYDRLVAAPGGAELGWLDLDASLDDVRGTISVWVGPLVGRPWYARHAPRRPITPLAR